MSAALLLLVALLLAGVAEAGPCTPGVNCYCDKVAPTGPLADAQLLVCEDFEAPTLYCAGTDGPVCANRVGQGAPYYGPWYDQTGQSGNLGVNSYWNRKYSNGVGAGLYKQGETAQGVTCTYSLCVGEHAWDPTNRWNANAFKPFITIVRNGEFNKEITSLTSPTNASGGGTGVFDGTASLAHRIGPNEAQGVFGLARFAGGGAKRTTFGVTQATAFPTNLFTSAPSGSGVLNANWKFNEWVYDLSQAGGDGLFMFGRGGAADTTFPFYQFVFGNGVSAADCTARVAAANITAGNVRCDNAGNFLYEATFGSGPTQYNRTVDWPLGAWGCTEAFYQGMGTTNSSVQMWFTGPNGVRKKLIDFTGMNLTGHTANYRGIPGYTALTWNNYANTNQADQLNPDFHTNQTTFRYEDNIHIRGGAPVTCAQIGFGAGGGVTPPPTVNYILTTAAVGAGAVSGAGAYPAGTVVTPVALAASGSTFSAWSGDCAGSGSCTVTMSADKSVTATFTTPTTPPPTGTLPAAPANPTVALGTQDATGPSYNVVWPAVPTATSYSYTAGLSDGSANRQGTVVPPNLLLKMPYMQNGAAGTGFVCVKSVNAAGSSAEAACNTLQVPAQVVVPPQLPTGTLQVDDVVSRCNYYLSAEPPDATGGWTAQFYRDGSNKVGAAIPAAPYKRSVELYAPSHTFTVQFTKAATVMRSPPAVTRVCP